jgi:DUF4097 and DUF4098 domain-containing protein YvlB
MVKKRPPKSKRNETFCTDSTSKEESNDRGDQMNRIFRTALILTVCATMAGFAGEKRFDKKFAASSGGTLTVATDIGNVKVLGTDAAEVSVVAVMDGRDRDIERFKIDAQQTSGGVDVTAKMERGWTSFWHGTDLDVKFTISVPKSYNVKIETSGGDVEIASLQGTVDGSTSGGNVRVKEVTGQVVGSTSGGDVEATTINGSVRLETSGGDIRVKAIKGDVDAETSGGNVSVDGVEGKVRAETSGGNVRLAVTGPNKGIHAETSGGNIEIGVAKNVGADLDAGTSGGEVDCDLAVTVKGKINESHVRGTLNGGGPMIYAHTSGGNVRIRGIE